MSAEEIDVITFQEFCAFGVNEEVFDVEKRSTHLIDG